MGVFAWCTRRVGGLSMVGLILLCAWVITRELGVPQATDDHLTLGHLEHGLSSHTGDIPRNAGNWTKFFAYYSLLIHALVFVFPLRACWGVYDLTRGVKRVAANAGLRDFKYSSRKFSSSSLSSADTLTSPQSSSGSESGDITSAAESECDAEEKVVHAIVIPNYKEEMDGLRETLDVLASHPQARYQYDIYLAMEGREVNAPTKAMNLISEYIKKFRYIDFTLHPSDIPGEAPGKSSNVAWSARKASERYSGSQRRDVIVTGIDADSHLSSNYFALVTTMHIAYPETATTTMYCPPIIFDRNAHLVPMLVRVADVLWCAAGLSGLYATSQIRPPTSVYSMPLELIDRVGGWDTDPEAIGEDLHMYLKCFFALNGNLTTRTVLAPVSQSNVSSGGKGLSGMIEDYGARYKQAMRHMWGALDSGFALRQLVTLLKERRSTGRSFRPLHTTSIGNDGNAYIPQAADYEKQLEEQPTEDGIFSDVVHDNLAEPDYKRLVYLFHRLFEAHFLPIQMAILVLATGIYGFVVTGKPDTLGLNWTFEISNYLRVGGFLMVGVYMAFYEFYHRNCVNMREAEMISAGLAQNMQGSFSHRSFKVNWSDYLAIPIVAPMFGSIPAAQAQICHFWTQDLVYTVSKKPMPLRQRARSILKAKAVLADILS